MQIKWQTYMKMNFVHSMSSNKQELASKQRRLVSKFTALHNNERHLKWDL